MKILIVSHTYIVDLNCEKYRVMAALEPDIEVTVVVPKYWRPGGVQNRTIESRFWQEGSFRVVPVSNFSRNNQGLLSFGVDVLKLLHQFRPDVIQVEQGSKSLGYAELIALNQLLRLKAKNIFFTWWNLPYELKFPVSLLETYNLHNTHGIIAGNQDGAEILRQRGYLGPIQVMPQLGVDEQRFRPQPQPELAAQLGIQPNDFVVGFVGRFVEEKGLLSLCDALGELQHHSDRAWKCLLLGRGPLKPALLERATKLGIRDRLVWVESVPHDAVPNYINLMSALVLPSQTTYQFKTLTSVGWKEQFGHVLIEAMACQVPVIGSNSGEIPHVIADSGLIFQEGDTAGLRDHLLTLMHQPTVAIELSKRGYQHMKEHYTNQAIAEQQLAFYRQLFRNGQDWLN